MSRTNEDEEEEEEKAENGSFCFAVGRATTFHYDHGMAIDASCSVMSVIVHCEAAISVTAGASHGGGRAMIDARARSAAIAEASATGTMARPWSPPWAPVTVKGGPVTVFYPSINSSSQPLLLPLH